MTDKETCPRCQCEGDDSTGQGQPHGGPWLYRCGSVRLIGGTVFRRSVQCRIIDMKNQEIKEFRDEQVQQELKDRSAVKYSIQDLDQLRALVKEEIQAEYGIKHGATFEVASNYDWFDGVSPFTSVEEKLRTYMMAGATVEDLELWIQTKKIDAGLSADRRYYEQDAKKFVLHHVDLVPESKGLYRCSGCSWSVMTMDDLGKKYEGAKYRIIHHEGWTQHADDINEAILKHVEPCRTVLAELLSWQHQLGNATIQKYTGPYPTSSPWTYECTCGFISIHKTEEEAEASSEAHVRMAEAFNQRVKTTLISDEPLWDLLSDSIEKENGRQV